MRILSVHNLYQIRGGEEASWNSEVRTLRQKGQQVDLYTEDNHSVGELGALRVAVRSLWSTAAFKVVQHRLARGAYDLMHVQNFFPLISPSVYYAARQAGVPVVQTLRNYRLICPNALLFREQKVCEDCLKQPVPWPGVLHGCYRQSCAASASAAAMISFHRLLNTWHHAVDQYIALTEFARQKFIQGGLPAHKIIVKPNFIDPDPGVGRGEGNYALFIGRLSVEKGLDTLLEAWKHVGNALPLKIVGDGPLASQVNAATEKLPQVEWLGRMEPPELFQLLGAAKLLIFPSKWYETFGRVVVEAFACGTPVIASNLGAMAELMEHGHTGLLFETGNPEDLAAKVRWLLARPKLMAEMRQAARAEFEAKYTATANYHKLMAIYQPLVRLSSPRVPVILPSR